jgi:hypothetical protein
MRMRREQAGGGGTKPLVAIAGDELVEGIAHEGRH